MPINIEIRGHVGEIVLAQPPVNAFTCDQINSLPGILNDLGNNPEVRVVLIRAEAKGFCAGVDVKELQAHPERIVEVNRGHYLTFQAVRACPVPVVTAAHGFVIGTGIGICGASDVVIASEDCYFSLPEIDRGAMGGAAHLSRMLPLHKVRSLFFTGGRIYAGEMEKLGGVEKVVPREKLLDEARAYVEIIAGKSRTALVVAKEALNGIEKFDVDHGYRFEQGFTLQMYMSPDSQKARDAFVHDKKTASF